MSTYNPAPAAVTNLINEILRKYPEHEQLVQAGVKIDCLLAYGKESKTGEKSDAIKHHGVKALGTISRTDLKQRTLGHGDALLLLDGDWWNTASDAEKAALVDHELYHLDLKRDDTFAVEVDDMNRPKVVMRPHDYELGEFVLIAKRHGMASQECKMMARIREDAGQYFWPELADGTQASDDEKDSAKFLSGVRQLAAATAAKKAVKKLLSNVGGDSGISSMTISGGGQSVTITADDAARIRAHDNHPT